MENKLIDYLIANPYSRETDFDKNLNEDKFLKEYFIKSPSYDDITTKLNSAFESASYSRMFSIFLYGYSGSGKTTYIRWFLKNNNRIYIPLFFDFSDVTENKEISEKDGTIRIFDKYFQDRLRKLFHKDCKSISKMLSNVYSKALSISEIFSSPFVKSLHSLLNNQKKEEIDQYEFYVFVNNLSYQDLLLLLLISYYECSKPFCEVFGIECNLNAPLLIVFDNIDHIEIEHKNSNFPAEIEQIYNNLKTYYEDNTDPRLAKIHFIFCLRDANCTLINRQLGDVYHRVKVFFKPLEAISSIVERRILIAKNNGIPFNDQQEEFIRLILKDEYSRTVFQPLFNYNYRKFVIFLGEAVQDYNLKYIYGIKKLSESKETINGARGIVYFLIIQYLLNIDFLKNRLFLEDGLKVGGDEGGNINPARILLTNLHNLSRFSFDKFSKNPHLNPVGLYSLNRLFSEIFKNNDNLFFTIISDLFLFHKENWCHLLTFTDKQVFTNNNFEDEKRLLLNAKQENNEDAINKLDAIKIHITPSGFIYLRDIIKHYEFFSVRSDNTLPLFSSLKYKINSKNVLEFEFLDNIDNTFDLTQRCITSLIKFIEARVIPNFTNSNHCFKTYHLEDDYNDDFYEGKSGSLYLIRIIDTHIRYIDTFRRYILEKEPTYMNLFDNPNSNPLFRNLRVQINKELTKRMDNYISLLKSSKEIQASNLISLYERNMQEIKSNYNRFYSINTGRD